MARFNQILVLSAISLIALAGCDSAKEPSTPQTSCAPLPAGTDVKTEKAASQVNYAELSGMVSSTKAAVQTGNFATTKSEFDQFEDAWEKVEDGIKAKSPQEYEAVEEMTEKVMAELNKSQPSTDQVLAQLQSLEKTIKSIPKSKFKC
jgi:glycerophosphoryl diester phosphodiesterase